MFTTLLAALILAQAPAPVPVELLPIDPPTLQKLEKAEIRVTEQGKVATYSGVPLAAILGGQVKESGTMAGLRALSDAVLLVRGSDGYQAAVSAVAVAMDPKGERYFLATGRDGKPLDDHLGPARLIVPGDPRHARWVRNVATIRLVRLEKLATPTGR